MFSIARKCNPATAKHRVRTGAAVAMSGLMALTPAFSQAAFPGGFVEKSYSTASRTRVTNLGFLPAARGPFTFPAPYNTQGVRITIPSDCGGSADCVQPVGYSYWALMNNHVGRNAMYIVLNLQGYGGPTLFSYDKTTDAVTKVGPLFTSGQWASASTETWYFSGTQPTWLYMSSSSDTRLWRYDVESKGLSAVFDINTNTALFGTGRNVWQLHTSRDDNVHSFTVRSGGNPLGCGVYTASTSQFQYFPVSSGFDECQIDQSGRWLLIKANNDDLVIDLQTGVQKSITDRAGAAGHSDSGFAYMVGADNWAADSTSFKLWDFTRTPLQGLEVFKAGSWNWESFQHMSHLNAQQGVAPAQQYACGSGAAAGTNARGNELLCFRLDGSYDTLVVAPIMTDMNASGGTDAYYKEPKANLDVTGKYAIWTSNMNGSRLDAFIAKIPSEVLMGGGTTPPADTTAPTVALTAPASGATVSGTVSVSANASDNVGVTSVQFQLDGANLGAAVTAAPWTTSWNSNTASAGSHTLTAIARDAAGNATTSAARNVTVSPPADTVAPTVSLSAPAIGATVSGTVTVSANASDNVGVAGVQFKLDGVNLGAEVTSAPYSVSWDTSTAADGGHALTAVARDAAGNSTTSSATNVTVSNGGATGGGTSTSAPVVWTSATNVLVTGNSLQKNGGCDGCADAGALSTQSIGTAGGWVNFIASETTTHRSIGLSRSGSATIAGVEFAFTFYPGGNVEVREGGVYKTDTPYVTGDKFRITVANGKIKYRKNGVVIYTSAATVTSPLVVDASLEDAGSTVTKVTIQN